MLWLAEEIRSRVQLKATPKVGIICGSGLGTLADTIKEPQVIPYSSIPGFPTTHGRITHSSY